MATAGVPTLIDQRGDPVRLGPIIGQGGEGTVANVVGHPDQVVKIYTVLDLERGQKLAAMIALRTDRIARVTAWPTETVRNSRTLQVTGFLMPRVSGSHDIHLLYGPKTRLTTFPDARWKFLVHTAANVARAFRVMHENGIVVGDVNHGNLVVNQQAIVKLIDCDSFQVAHNGRTFLCKVGVETHTPPELIGKDLATTPRTANHDNFGLAVVIFQLLFLGRHPYAGSFLGAGDMPIARAIAEGRYAYSRDAAALKMKPPPFTLLPASLPSQIAPLFERAFRPASGSRPTAAEWVDALAQLEQSVVTCRIDPAHQYPSVAASCPWCAIEMQSRAKLFNVFLQPLRDAASTFDLQKLWSRILTIQHPGPLVISPTAPTLPAVPSAAFITEGARRRRRKLMSAAVLVLALVAAGALQLLYRDVPPSYFVILAIIAGLVAFALYRSAPADLYRQTKYDQIVAWERCETLRTQLRTNGSPDAFNLTFAELQRYRTEYDSLAARRQEQVRALASQAERIQRNDFLERHRIWQAGVNGIGPGRSATLQSYGIETAADISFAAIEAVPGFGVVLTDALVQWRADVERRFRFDPNKGLSPAAIMAIDQQINQDRDRLERALKDGADHLLSISQITIAQRSILMEQLAAAEQRRAQVEANLKALH